jgi:hypothetical protein
MPGPFQAQIRALNVPEFVAAGRADKARVDRKTVLCCDGTRSQRTLQLRHQMEIDFTHLVKALRGEKLTPNEAAWLQTSVQIADPV